MARGKAGAAGGRGGAARHCAAHARVRLQVWGAVKPLSFFPVFCAVVLLSAAAAQKLFVVRSSTVYFFVCVAGEPLGSTVGGQVAGPGPCWLATPGCPIPAAPPRAATWRLVFTVDLAAPSCRRRTRRFRRSAAASASPSPASSPERPSACFWQAAPPRSHPAAGCSAGARPLPQDFIEGYPWTYERTLLACCPRFVA